MHLPFTSLIGLGLISASMLVLLMSLERRANLLAFITMYVGGILLIIRLASPQILLSMFLTGVADAALLATGNIQFHSPLPKKIVSPRTVSRVLIGLILWMLVFSFENRIAVWIPIPDSTLFAALYIVFCCIIDIVLEDDFYLSFLDLLAIFFAFQLVYMLLEGSVLVFAFMTVINLLVALFGAILNMDPEERDDDKGELS